MKLSRHAKQRWDERFTDKCPETEFAKARYRLTRREFKLLRQRLTQKINIKRCNRDKYQDVYYRKTKSGIIFVIAPDDVVVTAFRLELKPPT